MRRGCGVGAAWVCGMMILSDSVPPDVYLCFRLNCPFLDVAGREVLVDGEKRPLLYGSEDQEVGSVSITGSR